MQFCKNYFLSTTKKKPGFFCDNATFLEPSQVAEYLNEYINSFKKTHKRKWHPQLCWDLCHGCHNRNITCMPWITRTVMGSWSRGLYSAGLVSLAGYCWGIDMWAPWHCIQWHRHRHKSNKRHLTQLYLLRFRGHTSADMAYSQRRIKKVSHNNEVTVQEIQFVGVKEGRHLQG